MTTCLISSSVKQSVRLVLTPEAAGRGMEEVVMAGGRGQIGQEIDLDHRREKERGKKKKSGRKDWPPLLLTIIRDSPCCTEWATDQEWDWERKVTQDIEYPVIKSY